MEASLYRAMSAAFLFYAIPFAAGILCFPITSILQERVEKPTPGGECAIVSFCHTPRADRQSQRLQDSIASADLVNLKSCVRRPVLPTIPWPPSGIVVHQFQDILIILLASLANQYHGCLPFYQASRCSALKEPDSLYAERASTKSFLLGAFLFISQAL